MPASSPRAHETASNSGLIGWALFDWATQPFYTLVVTFLFAPYFVNGFVDDPARGQTLWAYQPDLPLMPASNNKLLTTAVSLIQLGPDYRFKTGVYISKPPVDGVIQGNLYLKASTSAAPHRRHLPTR